MLENSAVGRSEAAAVASDDDDNDDVRKKKIIEVTPIRKARSQIIWNRRV